MTDLEQIPIRYIEIWDWGLQRTVTIKIGGAWVPKRTEEEKKRIIQEIKLARRAPQ